MVSRAATQSREQPGRPTGGQFTTEARPEADCDLGPDDEFDQVPSLPVYRVPVWAQDKARAKVAAANGRLERAGIAQRFTCEWSDPYVKEVGNVSHRFVDLTLSHPQIAYDGWSFVAAIDYSASGPIMRVKPGETLGQWRPADTPICEHCGLSRHRTSVYAVRNDDGQVKQVGKSCLADFLGVKPAGLWALDADPLDGLDDTDDFGGWRDTRSTVAGLREVLGSALAVSDGGRAWRSAAYTAPGEVPSGRAVANLLFDSPRNPTKKDVEEAAALREAQERFDQDGTVDQVIEAVLEAPGGSEYIDNLHRLVRGEYVDARHVPLAASAVTVWARARTKAAEKAARPAPVQGFIAPVGEKITDTPVTVTRVSYMDDPYDPYGNRRNTLLVMTDDSGRTVKWFASGIKDVDEGQRLRLTGGRVKAHGNYQGQDETVLTRVKFETLEPDPA